MFFNSPAISWAMKSAIGSNGFCCFVADSLACEAISFHLLLRFFLDLLTLLTTETELISFSAFTTGSFLAGLSKS